MKTIYPSIPAFERILFVGRPKGSKRLSSARQHGFSLIEIALVLVIVGLALGGIMSALGPQLEQRKYAAAQEQLKAATEALYGFAVLNGRLPCPAVVTADNGLEQRTSVATGECANNGQGFLPAATLGLPGLASLGSPTSGLLIDPWGYPIRYAVSQQQRPPAGGDFVLTKTDGVKEAKVAGAAGTTAINNTLLRVCSGWTASTSACVAGEELATPAFIVSSTGKNGNLPDGVDETKNLNKVVGLPVPPAVGLPNDTVYVSHAKSEAAGNTFDDLFYWQSVSSLTGRLCSTPTC